MNCHHGFARSIVFRTQWLQTRHVASATRRTVNPKRKIPQSASPAKPKHPTYQSGITKAAPVKISHDKLASEMKFSEGGFEFPEKLLVYQPSAGKTGTVAFVKMFAILSLAAGSVYYGIQVIADENRSNYTILPGIFLGSIATVVVMYITAPYCAGVHIHLPLKARSTLTHLTNFTSNLPPSTPVTFTAINGALPWRSRITTLRFDRLRKLPPRIGRIANLAYEPDDDALRDTAKRGFWETLKHNSELGPQVEFFVPESDLAMKRSRAPGVWQGIWDQIPPTTKSWRERWGTGKFGT